MAQADGQFRDSVEDIANLRTATAGRNGADWQVNITTTYGPDPVILLYPGGGPDWRCRPARALVCAGDDAAGRDV
jgi:hypothetical protein